MAGAQLRDVSMDEAYAKVKEAVKEQEEIALQKSV